jgi:hypothetical protein
MGRLAPLIGQINGLRAAVAQHAERFSILGHSEVTHKVPRTSQCTTSTGLSQQ